jgi:hypothetical protein
MHLHQLHRDENGSVLVEATVMLSIMILFILGSVDFLLAFYDWNAATKAVQVGARLASVSNPVAKGVQFFSSSLLSRTNRPGTPLPPFRILCDGAAQTCNCNGSCPEGVIGFDSNALNTIVYGRGSQSCGDAKASSSVGMCDVLGRIAPANVRVEYVEPAAPIGLGYVGRPGGPVPTIKVSLQKLPIRFFFLNHLFGGDGWTLNVSSTSTAEDLSSCSPTVSVCVGGF